MLKSENPTAIQSQKWVVTSFLNLLTKKPYSQLTVTKICQESKLDRRTFYRNFESKEDVLKTYLNQLGDEYLERLEEKENLTSNDAIIIYFTFWKEHMEFLKIIQRDQLIYLIVQEYEGLLQHIYNMLHEGKESNQYQLAFNIGGFFNVLSKWISDGARIKPEEMATTVLQLLK